MYLMVVHLISSVDFCAAVEEMCYDLCTEDEDAPMVLVEIEPHSSLKAAINAITKVNGW